MNSDNKEPLHAIDCICVECEEKWIRSLDQNSREYAIVITESQLDHIVAMIGCDRIECGDVEPDLEELEGYLLRLKRAYD